VGDDNDLIEIMRCKDLRDRETGGLSIERRTSYSITNREYLVGDVL
jgi:hypothetical protein